MGCWVTLYPSSDNEYHVLAFDLYGSKSGNTGDKDTVILAAKKADSTRELVLYTSYTLTTHSHTVLLFGIRPLAI